MSRRLTMALLGALCLSTARPRRARSSSRTRRATRSPSSTATARGEGDDPGRQPAARHRPEPDGKQLYICASDDDTIQIMDIASARIVGTLPSGPDPELMDISPDGTLLYVANEDDNMVTVVDIARGRCCQEIPVGRGAGGRRRQPRRQVGGEHLRDHQHGPFHRHRHARDHRQRPGRPAAALCRVDERQCRDLGRLGGRRHRQRHRQRHRGR